MDHLEDGATHPVFDPIAEHALNGRALVLDHSIRAHDHAHVDGVHHERSISLFALAEIAHQELLGDRLLEQSTVLPRQSMGRAREGGEQQQQQSKGHRSDDGKDIVSSCLDACLDGRGVLVDLVGADDGIAARQPDRQVDRQEPGGQPVLEDVLRVVAIGELGRDVAFEDS